jgi:hypothetical protein
MPYLLITPILLIGAFSFYVYHYLSIWRNRHSDIPSLPSHLLWGNFMNVGKLIDPTRHGGMRISSPAAINNIS